MRVTDNTFILSGSHFSAVNNRETLGEVYGIRTPEGVILIDAGPPVTGPAMIRETLEYFKVSEPVTHLIITHGHWDHAGGAREFQESGAKVIISKGDAPYCANGGLGGTRSPFIDGHCYPTLTPDIIIEGDTSLSINGLDFEFIAIPGHTLGSIAARVSVDGKTLLFTGDALQTDGRYFEVITFGWQGDPNFCRKSVVDSMYKLMSYETDMILPGHGKVCLRNGARVLLEAAQQAFLTMR